jgi:hypothetical protein
VDQKTQRELLAKLAKLATWIDGLPDTRVAEDLQKMKTEARLIQAWVDGWYNMEDRRTD